MKRIVAAVLALITSTLVLPSLAWGATRNVNNAAGCSDTSGSPYCTINAAILAAAPGDTIQIAAGTYAGTIASFSKPLTFVGAGSTTSGTVITKSVTYTGVGPLSVSNLRVSGGGTNFKVGGTGNFSGLTISGASFVGNGGGAHGLFIKQNGTVSNVTVTNSTFTNHGQSGLLIQPGTGSTTDVDHVTVTGSTFDSNGEYGLRIDPRVTSLQVSSSNITNNAIDGLLLLNANGATLQNLTITGNRNGILLIPLTSAQSISNLTLTNINASNNTKFISGHFGSGITFTGDTGSISQITITGSTFSGNGIHGVDATGAVSQVSIDCSVIAGNVQQGIHEASSPSAQLTAKHIYWGCATGPNTTGCSTVSGNVAFLPFRTSSSATCTPSVDLGITKTVTPNPVPAGGSLTYTITATNNGPDPATGVVITDTLPAAVTFVSASSGCTVSGTTVACGIGNLASGQQAARTITATAPASAGSVTNSATIAGNETPDPNPANNSATVTTTVQNAVTLSSVSVTPASASLAPAQTVQLTATAIYSDNSTQDVTAQAVWTTSATAVATVGTTGFVTAVAEGTATITASFNGTSGLATITVAVAEPLPPDPASVAPPIDPTKITTVYESTRFLYEGTPRIQSGVASGTIDLRRAAVLRGFVQLRDGGALSGVTIGILGHPEYGHTLSRTDGRFDMAVNGGESLTIQYRKPGYIAVDRQVSPRWNNWKIADDVAMIPYDANVTAIDLSAPGVKVARGTTTNDYDGVRTPTLFFLPGTTATMTMADGSSQSVTTLHIRATEYTAGEDGPKAMPGPLPPQTAYTYCVELSADEAVAAGATTVSFSSPVIHYLDDFIAFPAGSIVPLGWYDRSTGTWVPADNGVVVQIVDIVGGLAYLDITGDGLADDTDTLIGTTPEERTQLAAIYHAGQSLWRMKITHFTPWDGNFPFAPPSGSAAPDNADPTIGGGGGSTDNCSTCAGSVLSIENQTLGENIPIMGTALELHYESERTPGHTESRKISIAVSGSQAPPADTMAAYVTIAGKQFSQTFTAAPNLTASILWDGTDAYGRRVQGTVSSDVEVMYNYHLIYTSGPLTEEGDSEFQRLWAEFEKTAPENLTVPRNMNRPNPSIFFTMHRSQQKDLDIGLPARLGQWDARGAGFGGWTLNLQHTYDHSSQTLFLGNGQRQTLQGIGPTLTTVAGGGNDSSDGAPATQAIVVPRDVAVGPDGTVYLTDSTRLRAVVYGAMTTIAGGGTTEPGIVPIPAAGAAIDVDRVVVGRNGTFYLAETAKRRVLLLQNGLISVVAGNGNYDPSLIIKESSAINTPIRPVGISLDNAGNLLIATGTQVLQLRPDGNVQGYIGNGHYFNPNGTASNGDGGPARDAPLTNPSGVLVSGAGTTIVSSPDGHNIRLVDVDGRIQTVTSGTDGTFGSSGPISAGTPICIDRNNTIYVAERNRVYQLRPDGTRVPIAGTGSNGNTGDGGPALQAKFNKITGLSIGSDGALYIADQGLGSGGRLRRLSRTMPGLQIGETAIPSTDGSSIDVFDGDGRHLRTIDALQGFVRYSFTYNPLGYVTAITDVHGNVVTIERDPSNRATAIVAPGGQRTALGYDSETGYLLSVTDPASQAYRFTYYTGQANGLLATLTTPRNQTHTFTFDDQGRLLSDSDPAGGFTALASSIVGQLQTVTTHTAEGVTGTYSMALGDDGSLSRTVTDGAGITTTSLQTADGSTSSQSPTGSSTAHVSPDPRFKLFATFTNTFTSTIGAIPVSGNATRNVTLVDQNDPLSPVASLQTTTSVNGRTYQTSYEGSSRTISFTSPTGRQRLMVLDANGQIDSMAVPGITPLQYGYDTQGRLSFISQGLRTGTLTYDDASRVSSITDPLHRTIAFEYDNADRITKKLLIDGRFVLFNYDAVGNLTSVTPPNRPPHAIAFTAVDLPSQYSPPPSTPDGATLFSYDRDRRLKTITRPDGSTIARTYDTEGRLSSLTIGRGTYQAAWNPVTGNLSSITDPDGGSITYAFQGPLVQSATFGGAVPGAISWHYDHDLALADETVTCTTATSLACGSVVFRYDDDKLITLAGGLNLTRDFYNGSIIGSTVSNVSDQWTYDDFGDVSAYAATANGTEVFTEQLTRDDLGRITAKSESVDATTNTYAYGYDAAGRLANVTTNGALTSTYVYDENGNRLARVTPTVTETATIDAQDRVLTSAEARYTYSATGDRIATTDSSGTIAYTYDELGNLTKATLADGTVISYLTDANNRRIGKKLNGTLVGRLIYGGGLGPAAELDADGNVTARFIYASRPNVPDLILKGDVTYRVISDHLGSPRVLVDADTGEVAERIDYDEFGNVLADSNPGFQPFGFAGGLYDRDTRLIRFGIRDYDPGTGRWTAKDPSGFAGGDTNVYAYAGNDPINLIDPDGLKVYPADFAGPLRPGDVRAFTANLNDPSLSSLIRNPRSQAPAPYGESNECVSLTKYFTGLPCTDCWRAGPTVFGNDIPPGTAIATFGTDGRYPAGHVNKNSGIFVSQDSEGLDMIDQWPGHTAQDRLVVPGRANPSNNASAYSVITVPPGTTSSKCECGR
jgi:RHS repeat-associated protein/uncharacterized repeat protein (TIGR01451 family)